MICSYWAWCLFVASSYKRYDISLFGQDLYEFRVINLFGKIGPISRKFNNPAGGEPAVPFQNKLPGTTSSRHIVQVPRYCISPFEHDFYP